MAITSGVKKKRFSNKKKAGFRVNEFLYGVVRKKAINRARISWFQSTLFHWFQISRVNMNRILWNSYSEYYFLFYTFRRFSDKAVFSSMFMTYLSYEQSRINTYHSVIYGDLPNLLKLFQRNRARQKEIIRFVVRKRCFWIQQQQKKKKYS